MYIMKILFLKKLGLYSKMSHNMRPLIIQSMLYFVHKPYNGGGRLWKADILAKSAGVNLGEILRIDYSWSEHHFYSNTDMKVAEDMLYLSEAAPMAVDIEPEDINVSDTATVVWAIA